MDAAREGNVTAVREWLDGGGDPNDTNSGDTPLLSFFVGAGLISDAHLDVARLLLSHGADVNWGAEDRVCPLHCCAVFPEDSTRVRLIQLFLDAGANVNARRPRGGETPLGVTLACSVWSSKYDTDLSRSCLDVVTRLLRAGAGLDAINGDNESAEDMLRDDEASDNRLSPDFYACKALISDLRAAGSTWKGYVRALPKELLRLRSLVARGRARERVRTRTKTPREIALLFAPNLPNELFWNVMTYWNPRY